MIIIGLTGKKRTGKDTASLFFKKIFNSRKKSTALLSFAQPLKDAICKLFVLDPNQLETIKDQPLDEWDGRSPRDMLKHIGDSCRQFDSNSMIKNMRQRIIGCGSDIVIITDVRYDNEAQLVKELGGRVIKIDRNLGEGVEDLHSSEKGISEHLWDSLVENNGTLQEFEQKLIKSLV